MQSERVTFPGSAGTPLAGRLDLPDAQPRAFALFAHCFTCSKDVLAASRIAQALTGYGIAVLRLAVVTIGAPAVTEHLLRLLGGIRRLNAALLVMHSPSDATVDIDNARSIFDAARHPKSFVSPDGADHLRIRTTDAHFAAMPASWASSHLEEGVLPTPSPWPPSAEEAGQGLVIVSENAQGPYG